MANPLFDLIKATAKSATGTTIGKVTTTAFVLTVSGVSYKLYQDGRTGDVVGAERVEKTVAKNDAQGDVRLKMEGLKDTPKDAEAEKAAAEAAAKAAEEAAKAKEAEDAKLEEALKAQREAEEAAALAEQQAQEQNGENPDDEQNPDDVKDENADEGDGESDAETGEDEKGPDTYKGGDENDDMKVDENGNPIDTENKDGTEGGEETGGENEDKEQQLDKDGNPIGKGTQEGVDPNDPNNTGTQPGTEETDDELKEKTAIKGKEKTDGTEGGEETGDENEDEEQKQDDNKNEEENNENKEEQNLEQEEKIEKEGTPTEVNDNNINVNNNQNVNTTGSGNDNLNSTYRHDNYGLNATGTVSPAEIMEKAQEKWGKLFEGASFQKGRISMNESDIELVGYDPGNSGWTRIEAGLDWAIRAAADREANSTVSVLTFVLGSKGKDEICKGIGLGINAVCGRGELPFDTFEIHVKGPKFNATDIETIRESASMSFEDRWARYKLEVSFNRAHEGIIQIVPKGQQRAKDDPEVLKNTLLDKFRSSSSVTVTATDLGMSRDRLFGFGYDGESAIAWAIREAASGNGSKVNVLTLDIPWASNNSEAQQQVLYAVQSLLRQDSNPLRNGVFTVSGTFFNGTLFKGCDTGPGILEFQCLQDGVRLLPPWANNLKKKFAAGNGEVSSEALNALGIRTVLELAVNEKKLSKLMLSVSELQQDFAEALKTVCRQQVIKNGNLIIQTDLKDDEMDAFENSVLSNFDETFMRIPVFASSGGTVSFHRKNDVKGQYYREVISNWKAKNNDVLEYFKGDAANKDVTWENIIEHALGGLTSEEYWNQYEEIRLFAIQTAAHPLSKIKSLDLRGTKYRPALVSAIIKGAFNLHGNPHPFALKVNDADAVWEFIEGTTWYKEKTYKDKIGFDGTNLQFIGNAGTTTTTPKKATGAEAGAGAGKPLREKLAAFERLFGKADAGEKFGFKNSARCTMPRIFAYKAVNAAADAGAQALNELLNQQAQKQTDLENKKKTGVDVTGLQNELKQLETKITAALATAKDREQDKCLVLGVQTVQESGIKAELDAFAGGENQWTDNDLILEAVCFYKKGLYAVAGEPDTRNYFLHSWITDTNAGALECNVSARAEIVKADGVTKQTAFGEGNVNFHYRTAFDANTETMFSPNNFVFKIEKDRASAWFLSEFDTTGKMYTNGNYKGLSDGHGGKSDKTVEGRAFPNIGKRRLAIHWTFIEDDDGKLFDEVNKRGVSATLLPCLFSPVEAERSMDAVNAYLKWKKEKEEEREARKEAEKKRQIASKKRAEGRLERNLNSTSGICTLSEGDLTVAGKTFENIFQRVLAEGKIQMLCVDFKKDTPNATSLLACVRDVCKGDAANEVDLSFECLNKAFYNELEALAEQIKNDPDAVFDLDCNDVTQSLTFKKRVKEDEETKKRHLLFDLKRDLKRAAAGSTIAAKDMVPYLEGLGLQKVLEAIFNGSYKSLIVKIPFDPYLKDKKDEWVAAFREICSRDKDISPLGNNQVQLEDYDVDDELRNIVVWEVNACASVKQFLRTVKKDASFCSGGRDTIADDRKKEAAKHAEEHKDYPNQIPLAILTALGEFGQFESVKNKTIDKAVEGLNQRILKENERERYRRSFAAGTFQNNAIWTENETLWRAPAALGYSIVLVEGDKLTFYPSFEKDFDVEGFKNIDIAKAKEVLPKSLAERMLWIKKTTEKKEGEEDKVTYAVDFDTAAGFEENVPLKFDNWVEHKDEKNDGIGTFCKPLNARAKSLMYLRYSLDPKAFLRAFLSEDLEDLKVTECKLSLPGIVKAEASFFDALQAMCCIRNWSSGYEISITYGSADNSKDAEIQKLVNDRFDPWADTYVVYKGEGKFRYADFDELWRFEKFKEDNPFHEDSTFDDIEKTKRKWFEQEEQRIREEAEEAERKKQEEEEEKAEATRQEQVGKFNAGGDITVDRALIDALALKGIILSDDYKGTYSVLSVIKKAAEEGSKRRQLTVEFNTTDQFKKALDIVLWAIKNGGNVNLQLNVTKIKDLSVESFKATVRSDDRREIVKQKEEDARNLHYMEQKGNPGVDLLQLWLDECNGFERDGVKVKNVGKVLSFEKTDKFDKEEEAKHLEKEAEELEAKEQEAKAWEDGNLSKLLEFKTLEGVFEKAGADEKSLNAKDVDVRDLGNTLVKWFNQPEHRDNGHNWFLTLDKDSEAIWKQMEKVAEAINKLNERFPAKTDKIFMHLDRENEKIFFNKKSLSAKEGGALLWDRYALSFLPPAATKDLGEEDKKEWIEKFGEFAKAVAENEAIKCINFNVDENAEGARKIWAVIGKEEFWQALKEELNSHEGFVFVCPARGNSWVDWNDQYPRVKSIEGIAWEFKALDKNDMPARIEDAEKVKITVPKELAPQNDNAEDEEQGEDDGKGDDGGEGDGEEGDKEDDKEDDKEEEPNSEEDNDPNQNPGAEAPNDFSDKFENNEGTVSLTEGFREKFKAGECTLDEFLKMLCLYVKDQKIDKPAVDLTFHTEEKDKKDKKDEELKWCGGDLMTFIETIASNAEFKGWVFRFSNGVRDYFRDPSNYGHRDEGYTFDRYPLKKSKNTKIKYLVITIDN